MHRCGAECRAEAQSEREVEAIECFNLYCTTMREREFVLLVRCICACTCAVEDGSQRRAAPRIGARWNGRAKIQEEE
jgi:hypothetical protein